MGKKSTKEKVDELIRKYNPRFERVYILSKNSTVEGYDLLHLEVCFLNFLFNAEMKMIEAEESRKRRWIVFWVVLSLVVLGVLFKIFF